MVIVFIFIMNEFVNISFLENTAFGARMSQEALVRGKDSRLELITEGFHMFKKNPLFGVGLGSFTSYSSTGAMSHNDYIEVLASTGIIGFLLYFPIYLMFYKQNKILLKHPITFVWGVLLQAFLIGFMLLGLGRPSFLDPVAILVLAFFHTIALKKLQEI